MLSIEYRDSMIAQFYQCLIYFINIEINIDYEKFISQSSNFY